MFLLFSEVKCGDSVVLIKYGKMDSNLNSLVESEPARRPKSPNTHTVTINANYNNGASRTIVKPFGYTAENVAGADGKRKKKAWLI